MLNVGSMEMGWIQKVKSSGGSVSLIVDPYVRTRDGWKITIEAFGHTSWGKGDTEESATADALKHLPRDLRRHFAI